MSIEIPNRWYEYPGVSVTDIINARYDGHAFLYLRLEEDRAIVEECIRNLLRDSIIKEIKTPDVESRYVFIESAWENFVNDCSKLLEYIIILRLNMRWNRCRKPNPMERLFYESCWGKQSANGRLNRACKALEENRKRTNCRQLRKQAEKNIESLDHNIVNDVRELHKKYHHLRESHTWIYNIIIETVYPKFIQTEVEDIEKNKKTRYNNYPKLQRVFSKDVIEFRG
jgi:hypothetical protein